MSLQYSTDLEVLLAAHDWLQQGHQAVLVTVAKTWGSSPRPRGSMLVMREDGNHVGSVSGGCIEQDLINRYKNSELSEQFPSTINYGVNRLELIIEKPESTVQLGTIILKIKQGELIARRLCMHTGEVSLHMASATDEFHYDNDQMLKVFGPGWPLLLIGAGHLSRYVASMALMLNYSVVVCDPREEYQFGWDIEGVQFTREMPDDAVKRLARNKRAIVITLAHDPKLDDMALMEALTADLFYVGALGSRRSNDRRRERLLQLGVTSIQLDKLHGPVGLDIGSHTPPEIAVSILAQITALRNRTLQQQYSVIHE